MRNFFNHFKKNGFHSFVSISSLFLFFCSSYCCDDETKAERRKSSCLFQSFFCGVIYWINSECQNAIKINKKVGCIDCIVQHNVRSCLPFISPRGFLFPFFLLRSLLFFSKLQNFYFYFSICANVNLSRTYKNPCGRCGYWLMPGLRINKDFFSLFRTKLKKRRGFKNNKNVILNFHEQNRQRNGDFYDRVWPLDMPWK